LFFTRRFTLYHLSQIFGGKVVTFTAEMTFCLRSFVLFEHILELGAGKTSERN
jgi:hypothetical protein